jgi:uncharacterized membrane protein YcfT
MTNSTTNLGTQSPGDRVEWVDYAKGFCIVFVVMMHSTLGVEAAAGAAGWLHPLVEFTHPFRIPDFFLISGLFLARTIDQDWRTYLDRKVAYFVYFLLLWSLIAFGLKGLLFGGASLADLPLALLGAFREPLGTLWFIHMLPIFFVVAKLVRPLPPVLVLAVAALLEIAPIHTGEYAVDQFCDRVVYFLAGYYLAPQVFAFAAWVQRNATRSLGLLLLWGVLNGAAVAAEIDTLPVVSLALGLAGAGAVVAASALMAKIHVFAPLRHCGYRTLVIYLGFTLFMATSRIALMKSGLVTDIGTISLLVTAVSVIGPLILYRLVAGTPARYLFERPAFVSLTRRRDRLQPAE